MKTRTILEKLEGVESATSDPADSSHYREIVSRLASWDGRDLAALLDAIGGPTSKRPGLPPLDLTDPFDAGAEFVRMIEATAERLRAREIASGEELS